MPSDELIPLPADDLDGDLAHRIGDGKELSRHDSFEQALRDYRADVREIAPSAGFSARLWLGLEPANTRRLRLVSTWPRWAAAAVAVFVVAAGVWFALFRDPVAYAKAGPQIVYVSLEDGSTVTLRPRSTLFKLAESAYRLDGEAFFDVAHSIDRVFSVRSTLGEVRVLGTRFNVSTWGDRTTIFLSRGEVSFEYLPAGTVDTLAPGEELVATASSIFTGPVENAGRGFTDWMEGLLVLEGRPVSLILPELEHHFGMTVLVPDSVARETLSGQVLLTSPEQSLSDLGAALGARFEEIRPNVFRFVLQ